MTAPHGWTPGGTAPSWTPGPGDWVVDPSATPPSPDARPRRRRGLLIGAAVLPIAATVAGGLTWRALTSGPDTPQELAEEFLTARQGYDWTTSWELLCHSEQVVNGPLDRYIRLQDAAVATVGPLNDGLTFRVAGVRPNSRTTPQSHVVDVEFRRDDETHRMEMLVVEEDGGPRACGTP